MVKDVHNMTFLLPTDENFLGNLFYYLKVKALSQIVCYRYLIR